MAQRAVWLAETLLRLRFKRPAPLANERAVVVGGAGLGAVVCSSPRDLVVQPCVRSSIGFLALAALVACHARAPTSPEPPAPAQSAVAPQPSAAGGRELFGAPIGAEPVVDFAALLAEPSAYAQGPVQVEGVVRQVCQRRGCWLELATDMSPQAPGCRVVLKGHAFFVPIDSAGARARLAGAVQVQTISAAQVAHMEEEGGSFPNKHGDGTASEVRIVASGVELARR